MVLSRGLREQLAANEHAARAEEAAEIVLAALEDPGVCRALALAVARAEARRQARNGRPSVTTTAAARDLKAARLAARGQRG